LTSITILNKQQAVSGIIEKLSFEVPSTFVPLIFLASVTFLLIVIGFSVRNDIDLTYAIIKLSNSAKEVILNYTKNSFSNNISSGLFGTLNSSELSASNYGLMVIRDTDGYCTATSPIINSDDLFVIIDWLVSNLKR
jgi:archaellin